MTATTLVDTLGLRSLPVTDKLKLIDELHQCVAEEDPTLLIEEEWAAELERRCDEHDADPTSAISLEEFERVTQECIDRCRAKS